jgi:hypothetical protein
MITRRRLLNSAAAVAASPPIFGLSQLKAETPGFFAAKDIAEVLRPCKKARRPAAPVVYHIHASSLVESGG